MRKPQGRGKHSSAKSNSARGGSTNKPTDRGGQQQGKKRINPQLAKLQQQAGNGLTRDGRPAKDKARWVIGIHSCEETLKVRPKKIREVWVREDYLSSESLREIAETAQKHRIELKTKSAGQLDILGQGHQGVALAVTESPELKWKSFEGETTHVVLLLDGLEDPHNLGSILRTAWLSGVTAILTPEDRAVGLTATVCKIASGGAEHVPVDTHANLASAIQQLKDLGFWIYGLSEKGARKPWEFELPKKIAWVVGNEGSGMRVPTERACDELVRLPQVPTGSSYNASIAAAMALAETCRQLKQPE